ncbi:MAG: HU family DNA-binding protein [Patescibacteria group bacterium]
MNKAELVAKLAEKNGLPKKQVEKLVEDMTELVTTTIKGGGEVTLTGFGTFSRKLRKERPGVNPQNPSQKIQIPSVFTPKFKAGKTLKDALKGKS